MQILIAIAILLIVLALIIYKIRGQFRQKELMILIGSIAVAILVYTLYERNAQSTVPNLFKEKYAKSYNFEILKLQSERLNNKKLSSKTNFVYNFTYIIEKDNSEFLCQLNNVVIKKIEDSYVFENFNTLKEECQAK